MANQQASTSRGADRSLNFDELNNEQRLKAALYFGIKQIAKEVEQEMDVKINSQVLATLCESLNRQTTIYASDLELFAKHARRTNVSVDDVKLLTRRNAQLLDHLNSLVAEHATEKDAKKQRRAASKDQSKKSSKNVGASSSSVGGMIEVDMTEDND